jgi:23S rRNA pseudouridine955/2504/2580 synthase
MKDISSPTRQVHWIEVSEENAGQRIDNYLFTRLKGVPKSHVYRILRSGEVRVNGSRCQVQRRLEAGDRIRMPPIRTETATGAELPEQRIRSILEPRILYEDEEMLVLNKPAGMAVHGGSGLHFGVIEGLRAMRPQSRFLELVHRLDRDTSGCLLIAKKRSMLLALHEMLRENHGIAKHYQALLAGAWARKRLTVDAPLKKNVLSSGERIVRVAADGKPSETEFHRLRKFPQATLVEARLLTGRTHQIRVHAKTMGHAILGDERYGDEKINQEFRKLGLKRLFLHASDLAFQHPQNGQPFRVHAPLDVELESFLAVLSAGQASA